jgi:sulfite exporter TauE/SafE
MLVAGFILGLLGSLHCIGMCGPIAMLLPLSKTNATKKHVQILLYHFGRIVTYSLLGGVFGLVGKGLSLSGLQQYLSIIIGLIMITLVVFPKISHKMTLNFSPLTRLLNQLKLQLGLYLKKESYYSIFMIGFFNGFLPCGMVYIALVGAVAMTNSMTSALYMALYGLGTIPLLSTLLYVKDAFSSAFRKRLQKAIPVFVIILGVLFIFRGLGLGIPYISPDDNTLFLSNNPMFCH